MGFSKALCLKPRCFFLKIYTTVAAITATMMIKNTARPIFPPLESPPPSEPKQKDKKFKKEFL